MPADIHQTVASTPEYALVAAILHQAVNDLRGTAPALEREASRAFFRNQDRHLEWLCDLVDLEYTTVQAAVQQQTRGC